MVQRGRLQHTVVFAGLCMVMAVTSPVFIYPQAKRNTTERTQPLPAAAAACASFSVILGQPTDRSMTFSVLSDSDRNIEVRYRAESGGQLQQKISLTAGTPRTLIVNNLSADSLYTFEAAENGSTIASGTFHTARSPGSPFSFVIIGDSHPERPQQFSAALYAQNLMHAAEEKPDFFMLIGDDFSVDTLPPVTADTVRQVFLRQRLYLSLVGGSSPLFLVNGNHEQASLANYDGTADTVAVWSQNFRHQFFPQPAPDFFYSGNTAELAHIGLLRDYYAWTWGDALFVVIDPYWHSQLPVDNTLGNRQKKTDDLWNVTLGTEQYRWLSETLSSNTASFKFVFSHHVLGTGRGGIQRAPYFEWGGKSQNGKDEFAVKRPDFDMPIHQLFIKHNVTAFIQGHDHLFARENLDGVTYITLAEPADPNYALYNADSYPDADIGRIQ